ncbi:DNA polymerase III subunit beta [Candidatus Microgenomates bacterium]|nr:DNA polymerase III subunit beta [Candidatus Microgenomates bacterium]
MKAILLQENFSKALFIASKFTPLRAQLPILSNFFLEAKEGQILIYATNLESGIKIGVPAKIEKEGKVIVPAKTLTELVAGLPNDKVALEFLEKKLEINCLQHKASLNVFVGQDFPAFPQGNKKKEIVIGKDVLKEVSKKVVFAASSDETRPTLTGILISLGENAITFVATDGFRLSLMSSKAPYVKKEETTTTLLLPAKILQELNKTVSDTEAEEGVNLEILAESNQVIFSSGDITLFSRIIEGKFPPYEKILPKEFVVKAEVDRESLLESVKIASIFARDAGNILKIKIEKKALKISANAPQTGENTNEVEALTEGDSVEVAVNSRYLLELLNNIDFEQLGLRLAGPLSPVVFTEKGKEDFLHIIMPVRVQG